MQLINSGKFRQFDYPSSWENEERYGVKGPRDYNLSKITTPMVLVWSDNDNLATPKVSEKLGQSAIFFTDVHILLGL